MHLFFMQQTTILRLTTINIKRALGKDGDLEHLLILDAWGEDYIFYLLWMFGNTIVGRLWYEGRCVNQMPIWSWLFLYILQVIWELPWESDKTNWQPWINIFADNQWLGVLMELRGTTWPVFGSMRLGISPPMFPFASKELSSGIVIGTTVTLVLDPATFCVCPCFPSMTISSEQGII